MELKTAEIKKLNEKLATVQEKYDKELQDKETDEDENENILENQDQDEDFEAEGL